MPTHKITTIDDDGRRRSFAVRPNTPLGQLLTATRADTRRDETPDAALEALAAIHQLEMFLEISTDNLALAARRDGATWDQIGSALGLTRQRAHQRWGNISTFAGWDPDPAVDLVDALVELAERPDLLTGPAIDQEPADNDDDDHRERLTAACRCAGDDRCDHPQRLTAARARLDYYQECLAAEPNNQPLTEAARLAASQITRLELELDRLES